MTASTLLFVLAAYLIGSIPFGLLVGLSRGVDPRMAGSGNIGATNVGRLLGGRFFALVFVLDLLKGLIPTAIVAVQLHGTGLTRDHFILWLLIGFGAIAGHMFSLFLKFKGGKGVATSAGVMLGLYPYFTLPGVCAIGAFLIVFFIWRYISLGSIVGAMVLPVAYLTIGISRRWPIFGS